MKKLIWISIFLNIILVCVLCLIIHRHTSYWQRLGHRLGVCEYVRPRYDTDCILSWTNTLEQLNLHVDVVFFGNSITAGGHFQERFPNKSICNLGYIGENTDGMLRRVHQITILHPKQIFVMAGINELKGQSMQLFEERYIRLLDSICATNPQAEIIVESILPISSSSTFCDNNKIIQANIVIQKYAKRRSLIYMDLHSKYVIDGSLPDVLTYDGLHLKEDAYIVWYDMLQEFIY